MELAEGSLAWCAAAVPSLSGIRDWFRGRQFFNGRSGGGDGSGSNGSDGERQMKLRSLDHPSAPAVRPAF